MHQSKKKKIAFMIVFFIFIASLTICSRMEKKESFDLRHRVKRIVLDNGLKVLLLKREGAPVFSSQIKIKVGNIEEEDGHRGLAHFFEHMAFKGTQTIGTKDYNKEKIILDRIFKIGTVIVEMKKQGKKPDDYQDLIEERKKLEDEQKQYQVRNEFMRIYQENGGVDLNATTSNDYTTYYVSLPVNKLELWAYMESERLKSPVLRDFFTEVDVVAEERRMRIDNTPQGKIYEAFMNLAFDKSPYKTVVIGPASDIQLYTPGVALDFYHKYYTPSRVVIALVGNFDVDEAEGIVRKYFSNLKSSSKKTEEVKSEILDEKTFPRENVITSPEKPRFYLGYHRPTHPDPDDIVFDALQSILCEGKTSRLYKKLTLEEQKVSFVTCYASVPGARLDSLFTFYSMPLDGFTNRDIKDEIKKELIRLGQEGPTEDELQIVKNKIDAYIVYSLQSNSGLASQLAFYESLTGNWEYLYHLQDRLHSITKEDIQRVVKTYFVDSKEVTTYMEME